MLSIGPVALNGTPRIVAPFTDKTPLDAIQRAQRLGIDIAEARIDQFELFEQSYVLEQLEKFDGTPVIATIRSEAEGGRWRLTEAERLSLFAGVIPRVQAVDIELSSESILPKVAAAAREAGKLVMVSYHDFEGTPGLDQLAGRVHEARQRGADLVKIATTTSGREHLATLANLVMAHSGEGLVVIGMGNEGLKTRLFLPALGSLMTYAFLDAPTAPGQLHFDDTFRLLRLLYPDFEQEKSSHLSR
jgi:3-dehydroquinate dehydratase-1